MSVAAPGGSPPSIQPRHPAHRVPNLLLARVSGDRIEVMPDDFASPVAVSTHEGEGILRVFATAQVLDEGVVVCLGGGVRSHIGAIGIGAPRLSLASQSRLSSTSSVITLPGHKEDNLAKHWAGELATRLGHPTVVVAGIHIDNASVDEIAALESNVCIAMESLSGLLSALIGPNRESVNSKNVGSEH
jgi:gallate decarboxylase subunit D